MIESTFGMCSRTHPLALRDITLYYQAKNRLTAWQDKDCSLRKVNSTTMI